jgi:hypothetical protein
MYLRQYSTRRVAKRLLLLCVTDVRACEGRGTRDQLSLGYNGGKRASFRCPVEKGRSKGRMERRTELGPFAMCDSKVGSIISVSTKVD